MTSPVMSPDWIQAEYLSEDHNVRVVAKAHRMGPWCSLWDCTGVNPKTGEAQVYGWRNGSIFRSPESDELVLRIITGVRVLGADEPYPSPGVEVYYDLDTEQLTVRAVPLGKSAPSPRA